jgi:hypothetical protein
MSFDNKHYPNRKDNRRVYKYDVAKQVSKSCRNHGGDPYSEGNRLFGTRRNELIAKNELANLGKEGDMYLEGSGYA